MYEHTQDKDSGVVTLGGQKKQPEAPGAAPKPAMTKPEAPASVAAKPAAARPEAPASAAPKPEPSGAAAPEAPAQEAGGEAPVAAPQATQADGAAPQGIPQQLLAQIMAQAAAGGKQLTPDQVQAMLQQALGGKKPGGNNDEVMSLFAPVELSDPNLLSDELRYASEVDAALSRKPTHSVRLLSIAVGVFFFAMILWAAFASVDEVTHADGQVIPSARTQEIQHLEGGILEAIMVYEGQVVEKGTPLARLDNTIAGSSYREAFNKALDDIAAIVRLEAEIAEVAPQYPVNLADDLPGVSREYSLAEMREISEQIVKDHMLTYSARQKQRSAELQVLEAQSEQRRQEVAEQIARRNNLEVSLKLAVRERDNRLGLFRRGNGSEADYLNAEQKVVATQGDLDSLAASLPKAQAAAVEAEQRISQRKAELQSACSEEINKRRTELTALKEKLSAGVDRVSRTEIKAPMRGTVKHINLNTVGGVVKPGESIMEIVPLDDSLLVEAKVRPADVAFLRPGQKAVVKISAYDFSIYGGLDGELDQISADTIEDKRRPGEYYYLVKVRTTKNELVHNNEKLPIIPGMMATVDILTGKKTILDYLLKPILKAKQSALRER